MNKAQLTPRVPGEQNPLSGLEGDLGGIKSFGHLLNLLRPHFAPASIVAPPKSAGVGGRTTVVTSGPTGLPSPNTPYVVSVNGQSGILLINTTDWFNVKIYGAAGNGVSDDTVPIASAIAAAAAAGPGAVVYFPLGTYKTTSTLTISTSVTLLGFGGNAGASPQIVSSGNYSILQINAACLIQNLYFNGTGTVANTAERAFTATVNYVVARACSFANFYDCVVFDSTGSLTPFYCLLAECTFLSAINSMLRTIPATGGSAPGTDLMITDCSFLINKTSGVSTPQYPAYAWLFDNIGSIQGSNTVITPANCTVAGVKFNTYSSAAGLMQFSNCVFEAGAVGAPAVWLAGTSSNKCKFFYATNCDFGQSNTSGNIGALQLDYVVECHFAVCQFGANIGVVINNYCVNCSFVNCDFECLNSVFFGASGAIVQYLSIVNPQFSGATAFINFGLLLGGLGTGLWGLTVLGGQIGTAVPATQLQLPANANSFISSPQTTNGFRGGENLGIAFFNGTGAQTVFNIAHGLPLTPGYIDLTPNTGASSQPWSASANATNIVVTFVTAPTSGTNNVGFYWLARLL